MTLGAYYDREGQPLTLERWLLRAGDLVYAHVAVTAIGETVEVSTVWLGFDATGSQPPRIFETIVFGGPLDRRTWRWPNEEAARAGHDQAVAQARDAARQEAP